MSTGDYKVADISLADYGRKEIEIAEIEMPGLMNCVAEWVSFFFFIFAKVCNCKTVDNLFTLRLTDTYLLLYVYTYQTIQLSINM